TDGATSRMGTLSSRLTWRPERSPPSTTAVGNASRLRERAPPRVREMWGCGGAIIPRNSVREYRDSPATQLKPWRWHHVHMPRERVGRHSHYNLNYHLVFTPKFRRRVLVGEVAALVEAEVRAACEARDWLVLALEVMPDHLHLFVSCPPKWAPSDMAKILKGVTARAALKAFPQLRARGHFWTNAFYAGTAGDVSGETVKRYIEAQRARQVDDA